MAAAVALALPPVSNWAAAGAEPQESNRGPDVVYVMTPHDVVAKMLQMAEVKKGDVVYDLGCGDGRIVVAAAKKFGVKGVGFDIEPERVTEWRANAKKNGVDHLVTIRQKNIFTVDLRPANVITLYLLPELNVSSSPNWRS